MAGRPVLAILVLLAGCASRPSVPMIPAAQVTGSPVLIPAAAPPGEAPAPPPAEASLPPPVTENQTFNTVHGVPLYRIGPGDVLEVTISRGLAQDKQTVTVRSDGTVSVGLATVNVNGATAEETADHLQLALAAYFREPRVEVTVKEYNSKKVTVLGAVGAAGRGGAGIYPLTGRTTLSEILARAGGAAPNADLQRVQITRADGMRYTVNLFRLFVEGELRYDAVLDAGDTVFVPVFAAPAHQAGGPGAPAAEVPRVFIFGEVRSPGAYAFTPNLRVSQVLAQASGLTDSGLAESVRVIRGSLDSPQIIEANMEKLLRDGDRREDVALAPNDIVLVPRSGIGNWNAFLAQLRPTLEFLTLTTATISATQGLILQQRAIDRGPGFR